MKITALLVIKCTTPGGSSADPKVLANASDVSHFGFFQRASAKEFILFVARTIASRTPLGQRQSVEQDEYVVYCYNRNGLCGLVFADKHYPMRSAFSVVNKVLDEYQQKFGNTWQSAQIDNNEAWPYLTEALTKFQVRLHINSHFHSNGRQDAAQFDSYLQIKRDLSMRTCIKG
ncbi:hypothetical protein O6H91_22G053500 [Diphasiastrum complanatum]|uniref:Uncharacterized protein n=1 Tax=Diphasiastrum complanatum TaxID=34168 RepID=A0ACC2AFT8_DIPCM|nr:hypothetical protein O6H91_22G053500 [Diphasiastrum complanatum]